MSYRAFHCQLTSIMEALTKAAVAEICELVDESYAVLQVEISRSYKENEALRRKLELIEGIIGRGYGGNGAVPDYGKQEAGAGAMDLPSERLVAPRPGIEHPQTSLRTGGRGQATTVPPPPANETAASNDRDVPIKAETTREANDEEEPLLDEVEGTDLQPSENPDGEDGPTGAAEHGRPWEQNGRDPPESTSTLGSPGPAGGPQSNASDVGFNVATDSDCEGPSAGRTRKQFLLGSGGSPASLPGASELKRSVPGISSLSFDTDMDLSSTWSSQGLASMLPVPHRTNLPDKASAINAAGLPLALGLPGSRLDPLDLNRYCRDRRFVCSYCGKCFTSSRSLETHVRVHTGERPYSCAQCGKRFTQSGHLKTHQSVHTGDRPFACEHCGKRFAGKQNLRIHQQKHHLAEQGVVPV